jgi:fatty-acyl-CoA synthase
MASLKSEPDDRVYVERLLGRLEGLGEAEVLVYRDRRLCGVELRALVFRYARALQQLGIGRGDLVALFAANHADALAVRYAASLLGAPSVFLARPGSPAARGLLLAQTNPALLVVFPDTAAPDGDRPPAGRVASIGTVAGVALRLDELAREASSSALESAARGADLGVIVSSGGTTGVPKGSWRFFATYTTQVDIPTAPHRRQLIATPLAYLAQILVDTTLLGGGTVILGDDVDPGAILATVESERITDLFLVEPALFALMDHPDLDRRDWSSLRGITHAGASAPLTLRRRAAARLGAIVEHFYGASEVGVISTLAPSEAIGRPDLLTTAGRVLPGVELRFRRSDGTLAPAHEGGVVEARSAAMAGGYLNRPEDQAAAFHAGWYRTGDVAFLDAEGYLHFVGRASDLRRTGQVPLTPIEDTLCQQPGVRYAVVVPADHDDGVIAAVAPWPRAPIDVEACREAVTAGHGDAVRPVTLVIVDQVPVTEQGKPDRQALHQLAAEQVRPSGDRRTTSHTESVPQ